MSIRERVQASLDKERTARNRVRSLLDGTIADGSSESLDVAHLSDPFRRRKFIFHALRVDQLCIALFCACFTSPPIVGAMKRLTDGDREAQASFDAAMAEPLIALRTLQTWVYPLILRPFVKSVLQIFTLRGLERAAEMWLSDGTDAGKGRWTRGE